MECPNCDREAVEQISEEMPRAHLNVGTAIMWCSTCGTVFRNPDLTDKAKRIMVPERGKS